MGRPGDGKGVHPVLVFQQVGGVKAVLAAGAGDQAVIAAVIFAVLVAQVAQFPLPLGPVNGFVGFVVAGMAGIADAVLLDNHGLFDAVPGVLKLIAGVGLLVAHDAFLAELHVFGQAVVCLELILGDIGRIFGVVNGQITGIFFHISHSHSVA